MQEKTKKYLKDLIDDMEIELNSIEPMVHDAQKTLNKIKKFHDKVVKNL
jgi:hypothetical protein